MRLNPIKNKHIQVSSVFCISRYQVCVLRVSIHVRTLLDVSMLLDVSTLHGSTILHYRMYCRVELFYKLIMFVIEPFANIINAHLSLMELCITKNAKIVGSQIFYYVPKRKYFLRIKIPFYSKYTTTCKYHCV